MVEVLKEQGITSALLSAGGSSIYALGAPPEEKGWKITIRNPRQPSKSVAEVALKDESMSTSGTAEKFFVAGGKTYSHIFDPRTGYPAQGMLSVSVIAPRTIDSEAWTKPIFIQGRSWSRQHSPRNFRIFLCEDRLEMACAWLQ
jgi:thiamine biosynthesis lipoprotein